MPATAVPACDVTEPKRGHEKEEAMAFSLRSEAFAHNEAIPLRYTGDGEPLER